MLPLSVPKLGTSRLETRRWRSAYHSLTRASTLFAIAPLAKPSWSSSDIIACGIPLWIARETEENSSSPTISSGESFVTSSAILLLVDLYPSQYRRYQRAAIFISPPDSAGTGSLTTSWTLKP